MFAHYCSRSMESRSAVPMLDLLCDCWHQYRRVGILLLCCLVITILWSTVNPSDVRGPPSYKRFFDGQTEILGVDPPCFQDLVLRMSVLRDAVDETKLLSTDVVNSTQPLLLHCHSHSFPHPDSLYRACQRDEQWSKAPTPDLFVSTCTFLFAGATYTVRNSWKTLPTQSQLMSIVGWNNGGGQLKKSDIKKEEADQAKDNKIIHFVWTAGYKLTGMMLVAIDSVVKNMPNAVVKLHAVLPDMGRERVMAEHRSQLLPFWFSGVDLEYITYFDVKPLFQDTPLQDGASLMSDYLTNYLANYGQGVVASDIMRLAVLYRDGGTYLDTDMVLLSDVSRLGNTLGCESSKATTSSNGGTVVISVPKCAVCNAMMSFSPKHQFLHATMQALRVKSKPYANLRELSKADWGFLGTKLMQDQLENWYQNHPGSVNSVGHFNASAMSSENDDAIHVYGREMFFPLSWDRFDGQEYVGHPDYWFDERFGNVRPLFETWLNSSTATAPVALHLYHAALRRSIGANRFGDLLARQPSSFVARLITRNCRVFCDFTYLMAYSPDEMIKRKRIAI
eukprot:GHVS01063064.1.p1 GENE.GHVS01063064.1~~GHVS01063064.1.p1  ORF type:complete len:563 (+),score=40.43 GHVS01063064.1:210-1898(+)